MEEERELIAGALSSDVTFRLLVTGKVGIADIERLIEKLELEKQTLAEPDDHSEDGGEA